MGKQNNVVGQVIETLSQLAPQINSGHISRDQHSVFPVLEWEMLGAQKLAAGCLPEKDGGLGLDFRAYASLLQEMGLLIEDNGLIFSLMAHGLACVWPLSIYNTSEEVNKLLPGFASGKLILANAMTEEQGGSDAFNMTTTAIEKDGVFVLNGKKTFCTNAPVASYALVYAETAPGRGFFGGISAFLVNLKTKGVTIGSNLDKMGLRTATASSINFENVEVPASHMVGKKGGGAFIFQESMVYEKIYMAAVHTGTAQRWLKHMTGFAHERQSGGNPIIRNQSVSHTLAEAAIQMEACKAMVNEAVIRLEKGPAKLEVKYAAMVKYFVSNSMTAMAQKYLNLFAGQGYLRATGVEIQVRDILACTIYSGTNEVQKNIIGSPGV